MTALDNAMAESFVDTFKTELIKDRVWQTRSQLELAVLEYVDWFNNRRLHESLGDIPPVEAEQLHAAALGPPDRPISGDESVAVVLPSAADRLRTRQLELAGVEIGSGSLLQSYNQPAVQTVLAKTAAEVGLRPAATTGLSEQIG